MSNRNAYVDINGVRWDTNGSDFEGWLHKKSKWVGEWRKRYFILKGSKIFFSKDESNQPHGMMDLVECYHVKTASMSAQKRNALEIKLKTETYLLFAGTEKEKDDWITEIAKAIVDHSSMHAEGGDDVGDDDDHDDD